MTNLPSRTPSILIGFGNYGQCYQIDCRWVIAQLEIEGGSVGARDLHGCSGEAHRHGYRMRELLRVGDGVDEEEIVAGHGAGLGWRLRAVHIF